MVKCLLHNHQDLCSTTTLKLIQMPALMKQRQDEASLTEDLSVWQSCVRGGGKGAEEMAQHLTDHTALAEDHSLILSCQIQWLTNIHNSTSRAINHTWLLGLLKCASTHKHKLKITKISLFLQGETSKVVFRIPLTCVYWQTHMHKKKTKLRWLVII